MEFARVPIRCPKCDEEQFISVDEARYGAQCDRCQKYYELSLSDKVKALLDWLAGA